ncbi:hypothetical protein I350_08326 [Cryptococcus amylolentus CBS 6273]|uniref:Metaxin glutathione S-transferase domain-containing protein n=1 Tax=Cryptococcus amylolentus CBS 6273 TaxID=1296118 RepID=A0A1E3J6L0_9TREE|nr:hypothetical protein I350_08326 [Cryptococcus amylolentus CBS 6273]
MTSTVFTAPSWYKSFYNLFPLVTLPQDDELEWKGHAKPLGDNAAVLWVHPSSSNHPHHRSWLSSNPASVRTQLLFLLRQTAAQPRVVFREWPNESSAPKSTLPALHLPSQDRLLSTDEIRPWLEATYPLEGKNKDWQNLPSQSAYDSALALSTLITNQLLPAYLASLPSRPSNWYLYFPTPPPLWAGLVTPLPASLTGDEREVDGEEVIRKGVEVIDALEGIVGGKSGEEKWMLGAKAPGALDALIASHIYVLFALPLDSPLREALDGKKKLERYLERVLEYAERKV